MKHILTRVLSWAVLAAAAAGSTSCLNEYLDKAPDAGLDEKEVFSKYANFKSYFYAVYNGANFNIKAHYPQWFAGNNQKFTMEGLTDMCDMTRIQRCQPGKQGDGSTVIYAVGYNSDASSKTAKVPYSWKSIRVANMTIRNIDMLQDATDREKKDLLAQAYFVRAYCHFELFRLYGSLPYIDKVMGSEDEWDLPRLSDYDMLQRIAADFQTAADIFDQAGLMRRDPASGSGHLAATDQDKPNGVTALAMKGRALLYSASPLSNPGNDISRWEEAAEANWTALKSALDHGYLLLAKEKYTDNFYGTKYTNEQLWAYTSGSTCLLYTSDAAARPTTITTACRLSCPIASRTTLSARDSARRRISSISSRPPAAIRSTPPRSAPRRPLPGSTTSRTPTSTATRVSMSW